jgi:hypothetical protein
VIRQALIRVAAQLASDPSYPNPEYDKALIELIVDSTMVASENVDELRDAVEQGIRTEQAKFL